MPKSRSKFLRHLSPKMVEELIYLNKQGVIVYLITSDTLENGSRRQGKSIQPLIRQHRQLNKKANRLRNNLIELKRISVAFAILSIVGVLALSFFTENWTFLGMLLIPGLSYALSKGLKRRISGKRIYDYSYSPLFPFKVFLAPGTRRINDMFIHGKIYIIDGHTAYLGSLNFTESGTKYNYETRVRITDIEAVKKIDEEFDEIIIMKIWHFLESRNGGGSFILSRLIRSWVSIYCCLLSH